MESNVRDNYLATEVMTATPQKLQLMLIEAALRFGHQANRCWSEGRDEEAGEALVRCQQIVTELLCGLNPDNNPELVSRVASVYLFIFRSLTVAQMQRDSEKLLDAMRVLEVERDTWRQVCEQLGSTREADVEGGVSFDA